MSVYGYDLTGKHPCHYFNDATEGIVARLQEQLVLEPERNNSLSVDPGIEGLRLEPSRPQSHHHADHADQYRAFIEKQYTGDASINMSHPYVLERGLTQMFVEGGCLQLRY